MSSEPKYNTVIQENVAKNKLYRAISEYVDHHNEQMRLVALVCLKELLANGYTIVKIVALLKQVKDLEVSRQTLYNKFPEIIKNPSKDK